MGVNAENDSRVETFTSRPSELLNNIGQFVAGYSIGQYLLKKLDDFFWIVEKLAQWSVPYTTIEKSIDNSPPAIKETNEISEANTLVRPLPWILFFPSLIMLRILKGVVNTIAVLLGMETITALTFVNFIHNKREKLKTIRLTGMADGLEKNNVDYRSLIRRLYSNILSALCFQKLCMESNACLKQNVEPMIVGDNNEKNNEPEKHNHVNDNTTDNNIDEVIKIIKEFAAQSSDEESDVVLTEYEDKQDDDSISSTNEGDDMDKSISENETNSNNANSMDDSTYSTPVLDSIAPSIKSQIIAEETEDSDVSTKGTLHQQFTTTTELLLNKEESPKNDLKSKLNSNEEDCNIDVLDELIRNSVKNIDIVKNGDEEFPKNPSSVALITSEFINNESHVNDTGIPKVLPLSQKVNDCNNVTDLKLNTDSIITENENNHVTDNLNNTESSSNISNFLTDNQQSTPKQGLGLNLKKHKHHRRKFK